MVINRGHPFGIHVKVFPVGCDVALADVVACDTEEGWVEVRPSNTRCGALGLLGENPRVQMSFDVVWIDDQFSGPDGYRRGQVIASHRRPALA